MADHAKEDVDLANSRRQQAEAKRRRKIMMRFYRNYRRLGRLAAELHALALALGVPLDRTLSHQRYAAQVATLMETIRKFRLDPDCKVVWPVPQAVRKVMPRSVRQDILDFLTSIKARREVRDGVEVVVPGPQGKTPAAWAQVMEGLGNDVDLWRTIQKLAASKVYRPRPVPIGAKRRAFSDLHMEVAAEISRKIVFSVLCRAHVWYKCRHRFQNWRGALLAQLTASAIQRAVRAAQGVKGMPRTTTEGKLVQLSDDPDATPGRPLGSSRGADDPSEIAASKELLWIRLAFALWNKPVDNSVLYMRLQLDKVPSPSECAEILGVNEQQAQQILADALDLLAGFDPHRPLE